MRAPIIYVGILTRKAITFTFNQEYVMVEDGAFLKGKQRAILIDGKIVFNGKINAPREHSISLPREEVW